MLALAGNSIKKQHNTPEPDDSGAQLRVGGSEDEGNDAIKATGRWKSLKEESSC